MTLLLLMLALYFLLRALIAALRAMTIIAIAILVFPVRLICTVNLHSRRAGARALHTPAYFLPQNTLRSSS
jgi:hypothetical protein